MATSKQNNTDENIALEVDKQDDFQKKLEDIDVICLSKYIL